MNLWIVKIFKKLTLISCILLLQACFGAGKTLVIEPPKIMFPVKGINIVRNNSTTDVPLKYQEKFY